MSEALDFHLVGGCGSSGSTLLAFLLDGLHDLRSGPELGACHHRQLFEERGFTRCLHRLLTGRVELVGLPVNRLVVPLVPPVFLMDRDFYGFPAVEDAVQMLQSVHSAPELFAWIKARMAARHGIEGRFCFVDQTPKNAVGAAAFLRSCPAGRFVHLLRDGRDTLLSLARRWAREAPGHDPSTYLVAGVARWCWDVSRALEAADQPGYLQIRYEDLVANPLQTLNAVLQHLGRPAVTQAELDRKRSPAADGFRERFLGGSKPSWTSQPDQGISTASVGRWRQQLPPATLRQLQDLRFEVRAEGRSYHFGELLERTGYTADFPPPPPESS